MKYGLLAGGMWVLYKHSFQKALTTVLREPDSAAVRTEYCAILNGVDKFNKDDKFIVNI